MRILVVLLFIIVVTGCKKETRLGGIWVEQKQGKDTLIFETIERQAFMNFRCPNDRLTRSGPYEYRHEKKDSIPLKWILSGYACL